MQIRLASIPVDDQEKALNFYTKIVGFVNKGNITKGGPMVDRDCAVGSVLRTCWQQGKNAFDQLVTLLCSAVPILLEIVPAGLPP